MIHPDILATIVITATVQSLFGVGVLLFGTPVLLLLGYPFVSVLVFLLPVSFSVNLLQVVRHYVSIDLRFYRMILFLTVPGIVLCLFLVATTAVNIGILVGLFLIVVALQGLSERVNRSVQSMMRHERIYFLAMGIVHGLTNLGGALLTAIVHNKHYSKDVTRVTIAVSYGTFVVFQLATLLAVVERFPVPFSEMAVNMLVGVVVFLLTEKFLYTRIQADSYRAFFAMFLFVSGIVLIAKAALVR